MGVVPVVLPSAGMGWRGGIRPPLRSLAEADAPAARSCGAADPDERRAALTRWNPDLPAWHGACPRWLRSTEAAWRSAGEGWGRLLDGLR
jgi:hypothetical protein